MNADTKRMVAKGIGGVAVGVVAGAIAKEVFKNFAGAFILTLVAVTLAHQTFDSPVSNAIYEQL
jgi:hypothetical protein